MTDAKIKEATELKEAIGRLQPIINDFEKVTRHQPEGICISYPDGRKIIVELQQPSCFSRSGNELKQFYDEAFAIAQEAAKKMKALASGQLDSKQKRFRKL